nr:RHS repeat-associated core domain-containing protein [Marinobacter excellens]
MAYQYDNVGRTQTITHSQNSAQVSEYRYEYDAHGNRERQEEENGRGLETTTYAYDNLDRLTQVTYPDVPVGTGTTVLYRYDAAYNRTGETTLNVEATTIADKTYRYNSRNQLTAIDDNLDPAQNVSYDFDANGNQTGKTKAAVETDFVYDVRDHLRSVTTGGSTLGQFLYDYRGMRIEKDGARGIERYSYDDQSVLTQFDDTGATLAKFEYGGNRLISLNSLDNGLQFYHFDALGSPVTLTKPDGSVQARYSYDAWGHKRHQSGESWNRFAFTGHEEDRETNLIYAKARYYDPDTGRFLSQDPWEGDTTIAPSLNKYLYAYANPTVYWDPDGRRPRRDGEGFAEWAWWHFNPVGEHTSQKRQELAGNAIGTANVAKDVVVGTVDSVVTVGNALRPTDSSTRREARNQIVTGAQGAVHAVTHPLETLDGITQQMQMQRNQAQVFRDQGRFIDAGMVEAQETATGIGLVTSAASAPLILRKLGSKMGGQPSISAESSHASGADVGGGRNVGAMQTPPEMLARGDNPYGDGPVEFRAPEGASAAQIEQMKAYCDGCNQALEAGALSPTGRVSTAGSLRRQASRAAARERANAESSGQAYQGHAGHVPDTTWTGTPEPYSWLDLDPAVNMSLGGQSTRYPVGYQPTEFIFRDLPDLE